MGIGIGTPCCGCRVRKWRIAMTANHGYYGTRTPREFSIVGSATGFDWTTVSDGFLAGDIVQSLIKMSNLGGNNWRLEIVQNGLGKATVDFTHDFSTGLRDVNVAFAINDNVKQVITIMDYDDARPTDFLWFPNRSPEDSIRLVYNKFPTSPTRLEGQRTAHTAMMTRSTDANFVYWNRTLDGDTHSVRADRQTGITSYSFALSSGTPSTDYVTIQHIATPFHISLFYTLTGGSSGPFYDGLIYDEDDPPLVEIFQMTELLDPDLTATTYRTDLMVNDFLNQSTWRRSRLQINQAFLRASSAPWLFDASGINAVFSPATVGVQEAVIATVHDEVTVRLSARVGFSTFRAFPKTFAVDVDGRFSGTVRFRISATDIDVAVSGRVVKAHVPSAYWPDDDEVFSGQFQQTKIWLPEFFAKGREHDNAAFDWMLSKDVATQIIGKPLFTTGVSSTPTTMNALTQPLIQIEAGSLPTGMSVTSNLLASTTELRIQGTPTADQDGTVQFRIRSTIAKSGGTGPSDFVLEQLDYLSKVYSWIVGTGSPVTFTIEYPSPFTNTATPPGVGFDWRIDGATAVLTPYSIPATVTGGTGPFTFSLLSGTLPPHATLNTGTGAIATVGINPLDPSITGSCVVRVVDSLAAQADSITYNWEYIG